MKKIIVAIFCLCASHACADELPVHSLFFTRDEVQQIRAFEVNTAMHEVHDGDIHLGAIMYYEPNDWTIWLQGSRWTPQTEHAEMRVLAVNSTEVQLRLAGVSDTIKLKAHQTYQIATGKIVEGLH